MAPALAALLLTAVGAFAQGGLRPMSSAEFCGRCHRTIVEEWKQSAHARAVENRLFQDALEMAERDYGAGARRTCLECHSPVGVALGDLVPVQKVSWEGVTCDYCHSIRAVEEGPGNPRARLEYSLVKSGPLKEALSTAHPSVYSEVHTSSLVCAPCHNYRNAAGFDVLNTYTEWKQSRYASEGESCQSCHMDQVAGDVVDPHVERSRTDLINLHRMPGSRSVEMLNRTIRAQLRAVREGDQLRVTVEVINRGAGHAVPTGSPLRQVILEVRADAYNGQRFLEERRYQRVVAGADGVPIRREHDAFVKAAREVSDTRLVPDQARLESFLFPIPRDVQADVMARFTYYYSALARTESEQQQVFLTLKQIVR